MSTATSPTLVVPSIAMSLSDSRSSLYSTGSRTSFRSALADDALSPSPSPLVVPPSPSLSTSSHASSARSSTSNVSLGRADQEDRTITVDRVTSAPTASENAEKERRSFDDIQILAISTHITELSYSVSDIQTRIFEIQELRHKSQSQGDDAATSASVIDKSLMALDERLEVVAQGVKSVNDSMEPLRQTDLTPESAMEDTSDRAMLVRKHAAFMSDWESVLEESETLREELKEDKWLTVFRTVTDQADGMMGSLEKAVNRCQEFIWQVHRNGPDSSLSASSSLASMSSSRSDKNVLSLENLQTLLESFEAKKKHYMPATTKVLSIIDKGVQDRVTKNGECLRRHAESTQRWKQLRDRIARTDAEMENTRRILLGALELTPSESASSTMSGPTSRLKSRNGYLTPPSANNSVSGRKSKANDTLSRSMSPFRKIARKLTGSVSGKSNSPAPYATPHSTIKLPKQPSSEPVHALRHRSSMVMFGATQPFLPSTPTGHKHSHSLTPDTSPSTLRIQRSEEVDLTVKSRGTPSSKMPWNSSTKVNEDPRGSIRFRQPSASGGVPPLPPLPPLPTDVTPYKRSLSRNSTAVSARPFSPNASTSTAISSTPSTQSRAPSRSQPRPPSRTLPRPPSRITRTPSRATTPLGSHSAPQTRVRPTTPSQISSPTKARRRAASVTPSDLGDYNGEEETSLMQRAFSPPLRAETPGGTRIPYARPPSRSRIPAPTFHFSTPSRPGSAMSNQGRAMSPDAMSATSSQRAAAMRAHCQTPESTLRSRAQQIPSYQGHSPGAGSTASPGYSYSTRTIRPSLSGKLPPSSFRDGSAVPRAPSRSASRAGAYTPGLEGSPMHIYTPGNVKDPLDAEVAAIVNGVAHGLFVERIDPPLRTIPREGEEIRAQYAFSNSLSRKIVTCRLTTLSRNGSAGSTATKKVMVRVGGGWQDLELYMLNRQAGI